MTPKERYKMHHSYLRRALNAGGKGYLTMETHDPDNVKRAIKAAQKAIISTGRKPASVFNHKLFYINAYKPA